MIPLKRNHEGIVAKALAIKHALQESGFGRVLYEDTGNIGKGYRRHDEVGTPFCMTVDFPNDRGGRFRDGARSRHHATMPRRDRGPFGISLRAPEYMTRAVVTTIGQDRPGLVNDLAKLAHDCGCPSRTAA